MYLFDFKVFTFLKNIFLLFFWNNDIYVDLFWVKIFLRGQVFISISRFFIFFFLTKEILAYLFFTLFDVDCWSGMVTSDKLDMNHLSLGSFFINKLRLKDKNKEGSFEINEVYLNEKICIENGKILFIIMILKKQHQIEKIM